MCGIAGFNWKDSALVQCMARALKHRGPDDEGFYLDDNVSLGHRRLSILDTSARGRQPMTFENLVIVHNGEIYNFKDLREQLKAEGYNFRSDTDTEVLLYSYHKWGPSCVTMFNGMWAFCIYDSKQKTLFLSRDRFGIKPLYYYFDGQKFIFASELKAIRPHNLNLAPDKHALNFFFYQKYIGRDLTIFENCRKLRPSENLLFDLNSRKISKTPYYDLEREIRRHQAAPVEERLQSVEGIIRDAVEKRLIADVPVGSFLSGGIDSSLISAVIAQKHRSFDTFSIGFKGDESYDELKYSKLAAEHIATSHHYDYMQFDEPVIELVLQNMDEPFGDASVFPTYLLSKITRRMVTVSLSGDAGDEVFGGYDTYKAYKIARYLPAPLARLSRRLVNLLPSSDRKVTLAFKIKRFARDLGSNASTRHLNWMATFTDPAREKLLGPNFIPAATLIPRSDQNDLLAVQLSDIHNYMAEDILKKVDLASMLNSLEVRVPFLDHRLAPLVLSLPETYKLRRLATKWLLKRIAAPYLPPKIIHRPKRGFTAPISTWIRSHHSVRRFLTDPRYYRHNLLKYDYVQGLFDAHMQKKEDRARELWLVFVFNYWCNHNLSGAGT